MDDRDTKCTHSFLNDGGHLATLRYGVPFDSAETEFFLGGYATKQRDSRYRICEQFRQFPILEREVVQDRESQHCIYPREASIPPVDSIIHIAYERADVYYDMHVPGVENYIAHGICHHNTGKTNAALWAAEWLMRQHAPGTFRCLIIAPLTILETVWVHAIFKNFLSHRKVEVLHGDADRRVKALARDADFYVVNHDGVGVGARVHGKRGSVELEGFSKLLAGRSDIRLAIVDEASAYKDSTTRRHRIARLVIGRRDYLWLMTGTPTPNAPTDAYGLAKLVNNAWGKSLTTFRMETMYKVPYSDFKWVSQKDGYEKARKILTPSIRFDISEVWDAPPVTTQVRHVELTAEQNKLMAELKRDLQMTVKHGQQITAINEAGLRIKFMQISAGAVYDVNHKVHVIDAEPRHAEIETVIRETARKVVIFVGLTSVIDLLYKRLSKHWQCIVINGAVSAKERADAIRAFGEDGGPRIAICDPAATSHGINDFVTADTAVWAVPCDKTELYLQGNKRIVRPGQKYPTTIVQIVSNPLEQEIFKRLEHNETMQGALLAAIQRGDW